MSQLFSLQCLFCQHLNPPDAADCSCCEGQLNLQPCRQCGAVDLRTATKCYRCGAGFSAIDASELDFSLPTWMVDKMPGAGVAVSQLDHPVARLSDSNRTRQTIDRTRLPAPSATVSDWSRGKAIAIVAIPLLSIATTVAIYMNRGYSIEPTPAQTEPQTQTQNKTQTQAPSQAVGDIPVGRLANEAEPSLGETAVTAASKPVATIPTLPASVNRPAKQPSPIPSGTGPALPAPPSAAADAKAKAPQNSAAEKCPPAIAALGLCDPDPPQEKP